MAYCVAADVYRKAGITSDVISEADVALEITDADAEIDKIYQRSFTDANEVTEWHDIENLDPDDKITSIFLDMRPVQSVTSLEAYNQNDALVRTFTSDDYWLDAKIGRIRLKRTEFVQQNHRVKAVYDYGYDSVPQEIESLSAMITGMRAIIHQIGGTYDDVTSYSLPSGVSIGVGEPYTNMREALSRLEKQKEHLLASIGQLRTNMLVV